MNYFKKRPYLFVLSIITVLTTISFGSLIPFLGFYSEDFFFSYIGHFYGVQGLLENNAIDRPFDGYIFAFFYSLLGYKNNILIWHISMFVLRLVSGYLFFFFLNLVFPKRLFLITQITLIFMLYPGFLEQSLPLGYQIYTVALVFFLASLIFNVFAIKQMKQPSHLILFTFLSCCFQLLTLFTLEFFIGLEVFRFLIIWLFFKKFRKTVKYFIPYLIPVAVFFIWRIFIFESTREITNINWVLQTYYSNPLWILKLPLEFILSFLHTVLFAFIIPSMINLIRIPIIYFILAFFISGITSLFLYSFLKFLNPTNLKLAAERELGKKFLLLGILSVAGALIPIILLGRFVRMYLVFDRYTITSMVGVAFVIVGFSLFLVPKKMMNIFITFVIFLSLISNLLTGFYRVDNWNKQQDLWWQISWRIPDLQKNTMLVLDFPEEENLTFKDVVTQVRWNRFYWLDYQVWAPGNLFYNSHLPPSDHFRADFLEDKGVVEKIKNQIVENEIVSRVTYTRDYQNVLIIQTPSNNSCLWVMDSQIPEAPENASTLLLQNRYLSKTKNVLGRESKFSRTHIFGNEPKYTWCYYFQKASLARQFKNWTELSRLTDEVFTKNLMPKDPNEWLPFIEGLIMSKVSSKKFKMSICTQVKRLQNEHVKLYCQT